MSEPGQIYQQIPKILEGVGAIGKDRRNQHQKYNFRGIDDVYNAIHPQLAKHKVTVACLGMDIIEREERKSQRGGLLIYTVISAKYALYAEDGSHVTTIAIGEGMDSSDKAANKAMSAAYKYALFQMLCIPTEVVDADAETPDPAPREQQPANGHANGNGKHSTADADKQATPLVNQLPQAGWDRYIDIRKQLIGLHSKCGQLMQEAIIVAVDTRGYELWCERLPKASITALEEFRTWHSKAQKRLGERENAELKTIYSNREVEIERQAAGV